jgi:hypothetical protein
LIWSRKRIDFVSEAQLISLVYQAAIVCEHPLAHELRAALDGTAQGIGAKLAVTAERQHVATGLTAMGRVSYLDAAAAVDAVIGSDAIWRDCSLIALGFFRVLEIEINDKLVRPAARALDFARLKGALKLLSKKRRQVWSNYNTIARLESTITGKRQGLMFGQINDLLQISLQPGPQDEDLLQRSIQQAVSLTLTAEGQAALADGRLKAVIGSDHVQRFRNPPAHGSFLKLRDAQACEELVTSALTDFHGWFVRFA